MAGHTARGPAGDDLRGEWQATLLEDLLGTT
jgi:hypothetical protein